MLLTKGTISEIIPLIMEASCQKDTMSVIFDSRVFFLGSYLIPQNVLSITCGTSVEYVDMSMAIILANALLVSSRFDYCNSLFNAFHEKQYEKLQNIHSTLCHI